MILPDCPFCGAGCVQSIRPDAPEWHDVVCPRCGVVLDDYEYLELDEVARREVERNPGAYGDLKCLRCSECGGYFIYYDRGGRLPMYCSGCRRKVMRNQWKTRKRRQRARESETEMGRNVTQKYNNRGMKPNRADEDRPPPSGDGCDPLTYSGPRMAALPGSYDVALRGVLDASRARQPESFPAGNNLGMRR
jgi:hypothetical protein